MNGPRSLPFGNHRLGRSWMLVGGFALGSCGPGTSTGPDGTSATLARVRVDPAAAAVPGPGDSALFRAFAVFTDGTETPIDVSWTSDDETIASIDADGVARAVGPGITVVRGTTSASTVGASTGFATFAVDPDTRPPELVTTGVDRSRISIGASPETVRFQAVFEDDRSVRSALAIFDSPLGPGISGVVGLTRVAETAQGVRFEGLVELPPIVSIGKWTLFTLSAADGFGNVGRWNKQDLAARGLTVEFQVVAEGG